MSLIWDLAQCAAVGASSILVGYSIRLAKSWASWLPVSLAAGLGVSVAVTDRPVNVFLGVLAFGCLLAARWRRKALARERPAVLMRPRVRVATGARHPGDWRPQPIPTRR